MPNLHIGGSGGIKTDPLPYPLSAEATRVRAMAQNTRARSANGDERAGRAQEDPAPGQPDRQAEMFRELIGELRRDRQTRLQLPQQPAHPQPPPEVFKPPEFNGVGSVEVFIRQFLDVAEANDWRERTTVLYLRRALKEEARDCGGTHETLAEIFTSLRARFGISPRKARVRLNGTRKEPSTSLQAHANQVKELINIAYPDMPADIQEQMTLDQFMNTLNNARLQEHLLAIRPDSLTEAITAGNEFLQIRKGQMRVKQLEITEDEEAEPEAQVMPVRAPPPVMAPAVLPATMRPMAPSQPAYGQPAMVPTGPVPGQHSSAMQQMMAHSKPAEPVQPVVPRPASSQPMPGQPAPATQPNLLQPELMGQSILAAGAQPDPMAALMAAMAQLAQGFTNLQKNLQARTERKPPECWRCGKVGHTQNRCRVPPKDQGNKEGQQ